MTPYNEKSYFNSIYDPSNEISWNEEEKIESWRIIFEKCSNLQDLTEFVKRGYESKPVLRSIIWKILLLFHSLDSNTWEEIINKERTSYDDLKQKYCYYLLDPLQQDTDPLSTNTIFNDIDKIESTKVEIQQDVTRTFPEFSFFRDKNVQDSLTNILFVYSSLNQDILYRQGMHELLAIVYWVVYTDSIKKDKSQNSNNSSPKKFTKLYNCLLSSSQIENDSFAIFHFIMSKAKIWYATSSGHHKTNNLHSVSPIVKISKQIQYDYLNIIDPILEAHLNNLQIEPQLWGIRWIRLMFSREFSFVYVLNLWDTIFAIDSNTLNIVKFICVAILNIKHDLLLNATTDDAIKILIGQHQGINVSPFNLMKKAENIKYQIESPNSFVKIYKSEFDQDYTPVSSSVSPNLRNMSNSASPSRKFIESSLLEAAKSVSKNMQDTSEWLGVNKFVKDKFLEVKERSISPSHRKHNLTTEEDKLKDRELYDKRNKKLANLLHESLKLLSPPMDENNSKAVNGISYVLSCLENPSAEVDEFLFNSLNINSIENKKQHKRDKSNASDFFYNQHSPYNGDNSLLNGSNVNNWPSYMLSSYEEPSNEMNKLVEDISLNTIKKANREKKNILLSQLLNEKA